MSGADEHKKVNGPETVFVMDFSEAFEEYIDTLHISRDDMDSKWYISSNHLDSLVHAALDSNKGYTDQINDIVNDLQNSMDLLRPVAQSACDIEINKILAKMDELFVNVRHVDLYKEKKDIVKVGMCTYTIKMPRPNIQYI